MNEIKNVSVFEYRNYRNFLQDYAELKKKSSRHWSYGSWAKSLGLRGTASLTRVLSGVRQPGVKLVNKFDLYFEFNKNESSYFRHLVLLDKVQGDPILARALTDKLKNLHPDKKFKPISSKTFHSISRWYYFVLREMVRQKNYSEDAQEIVKKFRFPISVSEVRLAFDTLVSVGLLTRDSNGQLQQSESNLESPNDLASEASKRNHEENLDLAKVALRSMSVEEREFNSVCLTMSSEKIARAKELIREFKIKFIEELEAPDKQGDQTCQLQIQFFPYTKTLS